MLITGASRGIGKAIAMRAARDGANIVVAAKTTEPHPRLPGTIHSAVTEIEAAGGHGLACCTDIRFEDQVEAAVEAAIEEFGAIDIVVNNASAISLTDTADTTMKQFDLMHSVNVRGTYLVTKACLASLEQGNNPHVLNIAPPLNLEPRWFGPHVAYTMSKYGMSMCVLGMSEEFRGRGVAVNALWPATVIATAAVRNLLGGESMTQRCRKPEIMGEAAYTILNRDCRACSGNFFTDEQVLNEEGVTDFSPYAVNPAEEVLPDFFV
jgi:citronellol/citronellal dehydrogenase